MPVHPLLAAGLAAAAALTSLAAAPAASAATTTATCKVTWGSLPRTVNLASTATSSTIADLRAGHHACYDRVVFELVGPVGPTAAQYATAKSSPNAIAIASKTRLVPVGTPAGAAEGTGFTTIRGLAYGGRTQGVDAVAVVTRARLPYRMFVLKGPGGHNRLVVDVAHRW